MNVLHTKAGQLQHTVLSWSRSKSRENSIQIQLSSPQCATKSYVTKKTAKWLDLYLHSSSTGTCNKVIKQYATSRPLVLAAAIRHSLSRILSHISPTLLQSLQQDSQSLFGVTAKKVRDWILSTSSVKSLPLFEQRS
jgi:hypothetical protein